MNDIWGNKAHFENDAISNSKIASYLLLFLKMMSSMVHQWCNLSNLNFENDSISSFKIASYLLLFLKIGKGRKYERVVEREG